MKRVRWVLIGPGGIAAGFAEAMQRVVDGAIVAVASRSPERATLEPMGDIMHMYTTRR